MSWCAEHGDAAGPVMEWRAGGGLRCAQLALDAERGQPLALFWQKLCQGAWFLLPSPPGADVVAVELPRQQRCPARSAPGTSLLERELVLLCVPARTP